MEEMNESFGQTNTILEQAMNLLMTQFPSKMGE